MHKKWHLFFLSISSILLRWYVPISPRYGTLHDDELLVGIAHSLLRGQWLGDYYLNEGRILSKPPGYSIFLAFAHLIPFPSTVVLQGIIVCSALTIYSHLIFFGLKKFVALIGFATTLFLPVWFGAESSRLYRDFYLATLMLLIIAVNLSVIRCICFDNLGFFTNKRKRIKAYFLVLILGLLCSNVIATKNVGFAPIVFSLLVLATCFVKIYLLGNFRISFAAISCSLFFVGTLVIVASIKFENQRVYGVSVTNNFTEGEFPRALNLMASVRAGQPRAYVLVTKEMRQAMYNVSPTLRKFESFLDNPAGSIWRNFACYSPMKICDESALWFPWEIRDAVHQAGYSSSATEFERTFRSIADEIQHACNGGLLACGRSGLAPQIGSWDSISKRHLIESTSTLISGLFDLNGGGGGSLGYVQDLSNRDFEMWNQTVYGLPRNIPANDVLSGIKAGNNTVNVVESLFALPWRLFFLSGIIGYFVALAKKRFDALFITGVASFISLVGLISQLAIADTQTGLYASFPPYYLPLYPFLIFSLTVGLDFLSENIGFRSTGPDTFCEKS